MLEVMQVGAADAAGFDRNFDLAGPRRIHFALLDAQIPGGVNDDGFHGFLLKTVGDGMSMITARP
jgi:hypothetical protein